MPSGIINFDSVGHDRYHVAAKYKVDKWTPFSVSKTPNYVLPPAKSLTFSIDIAGMEFKLLRR